MDYDGYLRMVNSKEYIDLHHYYLQETTWDVLGVARQENPHSSFLRWLLDDNSSHDLGDYPIRKLIETLISSKASLYDAANPPSVDFKPMNAWSDQNKRYLEALKWGQYQTSDIKVDVELVMGKQRKRRADIVLSFRAQFQLPGGGRDDKQVVILIENKVHSAENDEQTLAYAATVLDEENLSHCLTALYADDKGREASANNSIVFLAYLIPYPSSTIKQAVSEGTSKGIVLPTSEQFIPVNYQSLLDGMISPCLQNCSATVEKERIADYIRCLGQARLGNPQSDEYLVMAISQSERNAARILWENHNEALYSLLASQSGNNTSIISEQEHPFWSALTNVLTLLSEDVTIYEHEKLHKLVYESHVQQVAAAGRKHKYIYLRSAGPEEYESFTSRNVGRLGRDVLEDFISIRKFNSNEIKALRSKLQAFGANWLREVILFDDERNDILNNRYQKAPGVRYATSDIEDFAGAFFCVAGDEIKKNKAFDLASFDWTQADNNSVTLNDGKVIYIAKFWCSDDLQRLLQLLRNEYHYTIDLTQIY